MLRIKSIIKAPKIIDDRIEKQTVITLTIKVKITIAQLLNNRKVSIKRETKIFISFISANKESSLNHIIKISRNAVIVQFV